jgi:hypothetical protein
VTVDAPRPATWPELAQRAAFWAGLVCLVFVQHAVTSDALIRYRALHELATNGDLVPMKWSWLGPLFAWPLAKLDLVAKLDEAHTAVRFFNLMVFAGGLVALRRLLRGILDADELRLFLVFLVFATLFAPASKDFFSETFSAFMVVVGTLLLVRDRDWWAGPFFFLAAGNTPALAVPIALLVLYRCVERRSLRPAFILACAVAGICVDRWIRFGDLRQSGYEVDGGFKTFLPFSGEPGFSYPLLFGVLSILFSLGKGILFYFPGLWTAFAAPASTPPRRRIVGYWLVFTVGLVAVYAKWWSWYGGWAWGPRFFMFCGFPASYLLAVFLTDALRDPVKPARVLVALGLAALAFWVALCGLRYDQSGMDLCLANRYFLESACWYTPEFSAIFRPVVVPTEPVEPFAFLVPVWIFGYLAVAAPALVRVAVIARAWARDRLRPR